MMRTALTTAAMTLLLLSLSSSALAETGAGQASGPPPLPPPSERGSAGNPEPVIEDLGQQRYRIGKIVVDRAQQSFVVPGTLIRTEPPIEFVAVARGGMKNYETVLELDTDAFAFNLACILIGLDHRNATLPRHHFDPEPTEGDPVDVRIHWHRDGETREIAATDLFLMEDGAAPVDSHEWVYTGSAFLPDGGYLADITGTLIGFVHDPESIIQHRLGIGLGAYGSVTVDTARAPPPGTAVELTVRRVRESGTQVPDR
jgi:hypothetical protein